MTSLVDLNPAHLAIVDHILAEHVLECEVRAFSSRATWSAHDASDLDLAVVGDRSLPNRTLAMLQEAFVDSHLPMSVDGVDWNVIVDSFRELIGLDTVVMQGMPLSRWREVAISEITDIVGSDAPSTKNPKNFDGTISWLTPNDLSGTHDYYIEISERNLSQQRLDGSSVKLIFPGSLLLSPRAPVGYVVLVTNWIVLNYFASNGIVEFGLTDGSMSSNQSDEEEICTHVHILPPGHYIDVKPSENDDGTVRGEDHLLARSMAGTADRIAAVNREDREQPYETRVWNMGEI